MSLKRAMRFLLLPFFCALSLSAADRENRILFGSCNKARLPQPLWPAIIARNPDVFILAGDIIYADSLVGHAVRGKGRFAPAPPDRLAELYAMQKRVPGYARLLRETPTVIGTWDDHDYGINDGDMEYVHRNESQ